MIKQDKQLSQAYRLDAWQSRLINKSFYFAFFSKTTFLYQLSMTTNELLNTVHSILDSPSARLLPQQRSD